jgi:hypothetical protein
LTCPSNRTGRTIRFAAGISPRPEETEKYSVGTFWRRIFSFSTAHWPISPSPSLTVLGRERLFPA